MMRSSHVVVSDYTPFLVQYVHVHVDLDGKGFPGPHPKGNENKKPTLQRWQFYMSIDSAAATLSHT